MEYITLLQSNNTNVSFYSEVNRTQSFSHLQLNGSVYSSLISTIIALLRSLLLQSSPVEHTVKQLLAKVFNETQVYEPKNVPPPSPHAHPLIAIRMLSPHRAL